MPKLTLMIHSGVQHRVQRRLQARAIADLSLAIRADERALELAAMSRQQSGLLFGFGLLTGVTGSSTARAGSSHPDFVAGVALTTVSGVGLMLQLAVRSHVALAAARVRRASLKTVLATTRTYDMRQQALSAARRSRPTGRTTSSSRQRSP